MRLDVSQQMRMDQKMVLAPRMIQSMEILQLPLLALQERIEQEMLANPVLEMEEPASTELETPVETSDAAGDADDREKDLSISEDRNKTDDFERLTNIGDDYDDYMNRSSYAKAKRTDEPDRKFEAMQNTAAPAQSLNEYLHKQWGLIDCEPLLHRAGETIIDFIEDTGYLHTPLEVIAEHVRQPVSAEIMAQALALVQQLDPPGVGARDLRECLLQQLRNDDGDHDRSFEIELVEHHLKDIEMNRYPAIAKKTGRSMADIQAAIKNLSRLNPRPGLQIGRQAAPYVLPDVIVEYDEANDVYTARLTDGSSPSLKISTMYADMIRSKQLPSDAREFLQNNVRSARWLIDAIQQRRATLMRVVNHVITQQRDFFDHGPLYLKPLPMVEVANVLGIHVGTVSRAVSGKYMQTPLGIYPLRYFFSSGTETAQGDSVSWDAVKAKLQEIIDGEDKQNPFGDDALVGELAKHGITLARRTVAKYRDVLNIPPARRRRQYS